jgi:uncharacterized protein
MTDDIFLIEKPKTHPIASVMILVGACLVLLAIGTLIGGGIAFAMGVNLGTFFSNPESSPNGWSAMMVVQIFSSPLPFLGASYLVWRFIENQRWIDFGFAQVPVLVWISVGMLLIVFMPLNSWIYEGNKAMHLPEGLAGLEQWMRSSEDSLAKLTEFLTGFKSIGQLVFALFVIAFLAGLAEEVLFRGVLQNIFLRLFGNHHAAIWTAAFIFSAIHIQFYGFFPRMLLGAIFGYLYVWSQNLWIPIFGHFVNNGFAVIGAYIKNTQGIDIDITEKEDVPTSLIVISLILSIGLLYFCWKNRRVTITTTNE